MGDPSGKTYLRNAANDAWISVAVGSGAGGGGGGTSFDTDFYGTASADTSCAASTYTKINFDTATRDNNSEFNATTDKWVCATDGTYVINAGLRFTANATGYRIVFIVIDGDTTPVTGPQLNSNINSGSSIAGRALITLSLALTAGQTIEIYGFQSTVGALDCTAAGSFFQIWRIQ
jgi:hypothetical protein